MVRKSIVGNEHAVTLDKISHAPPLSEIIGQEDVIHDIQGILDGMTHRKIQRALGGNPDQANLNTLLIVPYGVSAEKIAESYAHELKRHASKLSATTTATRSYVFSVHGSMLTGTHQGFSEERVRTACNQAKNGILIIPNIDDVLSNEAYAPGVFSTLAAHMTSKPTQPTIICTISATKEATIRHSHRKFHEQFLHTLRLSTYNDTHLMQFFDQLVQSKGMTITPDARKIVERHILDAKKRAGASYTYMHAVEKFFEKILAIKATHDLSHPEVNAAVLQRKRLSAALKKQGQERFLVICADDVPVINPRTGAFRAAGVAHKSQERSPKTAGQHRPEQSKAEPSIASNVYQFPVMKRPIPGAKEQSIKTEIPSPA